MSRETVWAAGEFGGPAARRGVLFGRMYEDAAIELDAFRDAGRVFCIASAGCMALALAGHHDVVACDINPAQLAYARRRESAPGLLVSGAAERVMHAGRFFSPLLGWRASALEQFLAMTDPAAQQRFWQSHFDTRRFRLGFDTLMSPRVLKLVYAQPLLAVLPDRFGRVLRARLERGFALHPNAANPFARALLRGEWTAPPPPGPRRPIHWQAGDALDYLEACPPRSFDAFTLSNILDGASAAFRQRLMNAVRRAARPEAILVLRSFAEPSGAIGINRAAADRSLLWGVVEVRPAASL